MQTSRVATFLAAVVCVTALLTGASARQIDTRMTVAVPRATLLPVTKDSHPFGAAAFTQTPMDLTARGYVEEEFTVSGIGAVYEWNTDGSISTRTPGLLYTTRILVRRPIDPTRFSGTVLLDVANQGAGFDTFAVWSQLGEHLLANGHAWVGLTAFSRNIGTLRMLGPRYRQLMFPPVIKPCEGRPRPARDPWNRPMDLFPNRDDDVRWDVISQVGAVLKTRTRNRRHPMGELPVEYVFVSMQSAGDLPTYINAVHRNVKLNSLRSVFDGYIIKDSGAPRGLNTCAPLAADDPRRIIRNAGAPVIHIVAQPELSAATRRPDSDAPGDQFRRYEVPGASHFDERHFRYFPVVADLAAAGVPPLSATWTYPKECQPDVSVNDFPQHYFFAGAFENLDRWVRTGAAPPHADPIALAEGAGEPAFVTDESGNARGGVRSPWVDVPGGTFHPRRTGPNTTPFTCADLGYWVPFTRQQMEAKYDSMENYRKLFLEATDRMARQRWVTPDDAEKIKSEFLAKNR